MIADCGFIGDCGFTWDCGFRGDVPAASTAGFVTDDPWGDRQTPLPEDDFTRLLREGVPFTRPPAMAMEYSNLGYALLGRIISNVSRRPYKDVVQGLLLTPLGMASTGYDVAAAPAERRALGYRWEDNAWKLEPTMAHGAFGAMGGIQTSAHDYAKWVAYLLSAWPPRDGADEGPVRRSSVRELAQGANFPSVRVRPGASGADACRQGDILLAPTPTPHIQSLTFTRATP